MKVKSLAMLSAINTEVTICLTNGALHLADIESGAIFALCSASILGNEYVIASMPLLLIYAIYNNIIHCGLSRLNMHVIFDVGSRR
jgi:hypothetical protein